MTSLFEGRQRTRIKFCGVRNPREAVLAFEVGAEAIGAILAPSSRQIDVRMAAQIAEVAPPSSALVAVVGNDLSAIPRLRELGFTVQFAALIEPMHASRLAHGAPYLRVIHLSALGETEVDTPFAQGEIPLFDTAGGKWLGGSGQPFRWARIASVAARRAVVVAGGLDSRNVGACVQTVRPFAVDVRSGIETFDRKSVTKMRAFVRAVREADAAVYAS